MPSGKVTEFMNILQSSGLHVADVRLFPVKYNKTKGLGPLEPCTSGPVFPGFTPGRKLANRIALT